MAPEMAMPAMGGGGGDILGQLLSQGGGGGQGGIAALLAMLAGLGPQEETMEGEGGMGQGGMGQQGGGLAALLAQLQGGQGMGAMPPGMPPMPTGKEQRTQSVPQPMMQ